MEPLLPLPLLTDRASGEEDGRVVLLLLPLPRLAFDNVLPPPTLP